MPIEFDPLKSRVNLTKHGLSLAEADGFDFAAAVILEDRRAEYGEVRYRAFSVMGGQGFCLVFTITGATTIRAISYRRAHRKELRRHGL